MSLAAFDPDAIMAASAPRTARTLLKPLNR
jgi:hypothetical protein